MTLSPIDLGIIIGYVVLVIVLGWLLSRRAGQNIESYFLGGRNIPWYILGVSHGASGFDITGTMWFALMLFAYGAKGVWILWIWPMFAMIFRMMYLGAWIRRSNVLTGAEWMYTRFGGGGARLAHLSMVLYAILGVVGFLAYAFKGIGKFAEVFFPWDLAVSMGDLQLPSTDVYAIVILLITAAYLIAGGMYSVVFTDLIQFAILSFSAVCIAWIAIQNTTPEQITAAVPEGWSNVFFGRHHDLDWSNLIPALENQFLEDKWNPFAWFIGLMLFKGVLVSMAGPTPGYGIQHVLATRSPREAALESWWISVVAFFPRFLMIAAIVVLGLVFFAPEINAMGSDIDFEQILPMVINTYVPIGLKGLILAGLLAAFMSTFDSTVNAGSAYVVNDVYKRYIDPNAPDKRYVYAGYLCSFLIVLAGIAFGLRADSIGSATKWIVTALFGGFTAPNILKWHWWRFNGYGFFAGMITGGLGATLIPMFTENLPPLYQFPIILLISTVASVVVCLATPPEKPELLASFYGTVRPWGFWGPVYRRLRERMPDIRSNRSALRDLTNCGVGIAWQSSIVALPIYIVIRNYSFLALTAAVLIVASVYLKFSWYNYLGRDDLQLSPEELESLQKGAGYGPQTQRVAE